MPQRTVDLDFLKRSEFIAPGQMGFIRNRMFKRETLQRPPLGQAMTRGRPKQPPGFTYGMKTENDPYAMAKCMTWSSLSDPRDPSTFQSDFEKTNVQSAKANIHQVPPWLRFREEKDYRVDPNRAQGLRFLKPNFPVDMSFGVPPRPVTPIACVLAHQYKTEFDQHAIEANKQFMTEKAIASNKTPQPYDTLKSVVSVVPLPREPPPDKLWKMHRFRSQAPRVGSHWSKDEERKLWAKMFEKPG